MNTRNCSAAYVNRIYPELTIYRSRLPTIINPTSEYLFGKKYPISLIFYFNLTSYHNFIFILLK